MILKHGLINDSLVWVCVYIWNHCVVQIIRLGCLWCLVPVWYKVQLMILVCCFGTDSRLLQVEALASSVFCHMVTRLSSTNAFSHMSILVRASVTVSLDFQVKTLELHF
jgi:hypothetical protein